MSLISELQVYYNVLDPRSERLHTAIIPQTRFSRDHLGECIENRIQQEQERACQLLACYSPSLICRSLFWLDTLPGTQKPWVTMANLRDRLNLNDALRYVSMSCSDTGFLGKWNSGRIIGLRNDFLKYFPLFYRWRAFSKNIQKLEQEKHLGSKCWKQWKTTSSG